MDGIQTPSGLETPSGMASVVSTVAGGLETPDFLELRKTAARPPSEANDGPRSLYQVVPERQTSVRGLMGSERGYDVSGLAGNGASIPVLGDERGTKVRYSVDHHRIFRAYASQPSARQTVSTCPSMLQSLKVCLKKSCDGNMTLTRAEVPACLALERTFRIWWLRRVRSGRSRTNSENRSGVKSSNSSWLLSMPHGYFAPTSRFTVPLTSLMFSPELLPNLRTPFYERQRSDFALCIAV